MSLQFHIEQLRMLTEHTDKIWQRVTTCADAFNGSMPADADPPAPLGGGHSLNSQFEEVITQLQRNMKAIQREVERIEDQVLDSSKSAVSMAGTGTISRAGY